MGFNVKTSWLCGAWKLNCDYRMLSWRSHALLRATATLCMVNCFLLRRIRPFRLLHVRINSASINHLQGPWIGMPADRQTQPSRDAKPWPTWNSLRPRSIRITRPLRERSHSSLIAGPMWVSHVSLLQDKQQNNGVDKASADPAAREPWRSERPPNLQNIRNFCEFFPTGSCFLAVLRQNSYCYKIWEKLC